MRRVTLDGKNILVAGASGFIGVNLLKYLTKTKANLFGTLYAKPMPVNIPDVTLRQCDLTTKDGCRKAVEGMDYVFMCAANSSGAAVMEKTPLVHLTPNVIMNAMMLEAAYEADVSKLCFISSNTVYPNVEHAVTENEASFEFFEKYHIVGWMKRFSEIMCDMYSNHIKTPMDTLVVRPGNLYGPFDKFNWQESKVVAALIRRAIEKQNPLEIWGDGHDVKDFLYIDDFVEGLIKAFTSNEIKEPINIASGSSVTIRDVLHEILEATRYQHADVRFDSTKPSMIPIRRIDTSAMTRETGWTPKTSLTQGVRQTVAWYSSYFQDSSPEEKQ